MKIREVVVTGQNQVELQRNDFDVTIQSPNELLIENS